MVEFHMNAAADSNRICLEFASALCARLCHDLSSPLGTVAGTLELATDDPATADEAIAIATEATSAAVARLQLLRAAWAGECGPMSRARLQELAAGLPPRVRADLEDLTDTTFAGLHARIFLNLMLLGADALPAGGVVALAGDPHSGTILTVTGASVSWDAGLAAILADPAAAGGGEPRTVQMPFTVRLAQAAGLRLSFLLPPAPGPHHAPRLLLAPL